MDELELAVECARPRSPRQSRLADRFQRDERVVPRGKPFDERELHTLPVRRRSGERETRIRQPRSGRPRRRKVHCEPPRSLNDARAAQIERGTQNDYVNVTGWAVASRRTCSKK